MSFLSQRIEKLETSKSKMQIIRVDRIHLDPLNDTLYPRFDPELCADDRDLIESIREVGLLQPLCVRPHERLADEFIVVAGHRRLQACRKAGIKMVECLSLSAESEEDQITMKMDLVLSNRTRDKSNPAIQAKEVAFLANHMRELKKINPERFKGFTIRSLIAAELGVSERTIASAEKINNNLDSETYEAFTSGQITQKQALEKADLNISKSRSNIHSETIGFDKVDHTIQEAISIILIDEILVKDALYKLDDKDQFFAIVKDQHLRLHTKFENTKYALFFDSRGAVVKISSFEKAVRLSINQIYQAILCEYQKRRQVCIDTIATKNDKGNVLSVSCDAPPSEFVLQSTISKLENCISQLVDNSVLCADVALQTYISKLMERLTELATNQM